MAGQVNLQATQDQVNASGTVADANNTIKVLDAAKGELVGGGKDALKQLFEYDKSLSERYSNPSSQMYMENPMDREKAINGYFAAGKSEVTNLFDLSDKVQTLKEQLSKAIDTVSKSGSDSLKLSDALSFLNTEDNTLPEPPMSLVPGAAAFYKPREDGTFEWKTGKPGQAVDGFTEYSPTTRVDKEQLLSDAFGMDKKTLAQLNAIAVMNPKLADKLFAQVVSSNVKATAKSSSVTTEQVVKEAKAGYSNKEDALADLNTNRSELIAAGVDVNQVEREINTYFYEKEQKDAKSKSTTIDWSKPLDEQLK